MQIDDVIQRVERRQYECRAIVKLLDQHGVNVTWERVNRHYRACHLWYYGMITTGTLKRMTGIGRL